MALTIERDDVPLTTTRDGVVVVTGTRVSLDLIVAAFISGASAEEIADQYPSVPVADVSAAVAYYLRHRDDVEAYLEQRREKSDEVRAASELRSDPKGIRERLLVRYRRRE